ncbi:uncharacterized protein SPAR_O04930 [Saccharomyces paradoxus]|uniref:YHL044W-like protein n=1 Tax=Saccharomyces paradoxus TaxID=27291 RepID=A0A8B8V0F8_SACPA|nr:uncharacterized protein SPAR_O04930 [Saccharomyces paradoxus]QHS76465.1 hypothetical protein SPAR_O04930 [Saccharomyces paradoxus]
MSSELLLSDSKTRAEGPGKLCEAETIILPRDTSPSRCAYFFKRNTIIIPFTVIYIMAMIILICLASSAHSNGLIITFMFLSIIILPYMLGFFVYLNCAKYKLRCLDNDCKFKLLAEVITHKPNVDMSTWDRIAYEMNQFVHDHDICADKSFFYDGNSCYQVFKKLVIAPRLASSNTNNVNADLEMRDNRITNNNDFGNSTLNMELGTYISKALSVYRDSVDKYWEDKYPEITV